MSGMGFVIAILFDVLPHVDPRKKNYSKFEHFYDQFCIFMQLFLFGMTSITLVENFRPGTVNIPLVITIAIGILFLFIGNELPKVKSNFFMGIRTPWALCSEENWRRTHRLGGKCFFTAGIILILAAFLPSQKLVFGIMFAMIMVQAWFPPLCLISGIVKESDFRKKLRPDNNVRPEYLFTLHQIFLTASEPYLLESEVQIHGD